MSSAPSTPDPLGPELSSDQRERLAGRIFDSIHRNQEDRDRRALADKPEGARNQHRCWNPRCKAPLPADRSAWSCEANRAFCSDQCRRSFRRAAPASKDPLGCPESYWGLR